MFLRTLLILALALPLGRHAARGQSVAPGDTAQVTLGPGDVIRVSVYHEPELNGEFPVDDRGIAVLPLIGPRHVAGVPLDELRDSLTADYRETLRNPSITIIPLRRVNVLGEVTRPGMYPLDPTVSLAGAIALAGGATPTGDLRKIRIVRGNQVLREGVGAGETLTSAGVRSNDQIYVERRGWFDRNSTFVISALLSITGVVASIIVASGRSGN